MNEISVIYNEDGSAVYTIIGEDKKEDCFGAVYDYFSSNGDLVTSNRGYSIIVTPNEMGTKEAKSLYENAEQEIKKILTTKNMQIEFNTKNNIDAPEKDELPRRLNSTSGKPILPRHDTGINYRDKEQSTIETENFANAQEPVKTEITKNITTALEGYANSSSGKYKVEANPDTSVPPKLIDTKTKQEVITPQKQSNGELAFAVKSPELVSIIKNAFPPQQRFKVKCGSFESAKTIIEQMGGPQNLTFDDNANPKISEFKDELKATYPELKFSSDQPSNRSKIKLG
jgi:hypothetical protein